MRVGILGLLHESNTFINATTTWQHFQRDLLLEGADVCSLAATHHEIGGFFQALEKHHLQPVPVFVARAVPYGIIDATTYQRLLERMSAACREAGAVDGWLVAAHGATVSQEVADVDGDWLTRLRQIAGPHVPIVGTLDPHANVSSRMVAACDALVAYRTNPHVDQQQCGVQAVQLLAGMLRSDWRPTMAVCTPPLVINIERQNTADDHLRWLYELGDRMLAEGQAISNSVCLGFPYADVPEMGSALLVVTDNNPQAAQQLADDWGYRLWQRRDAMLGQLLSVADAVSEAARLPGPVCLLDMGDNVGGGSPGDGTVLARALADAGVGASLIVICDPPAVTAARQAGAGNRLQLAVGGRAEGLHGPPIEGMFRVAGIYDGRFEETEVRHGGFRWFDQGPTVVLESETGLTLLVTTHRVAPFSLRQLTSCGLDPRRFQVLVAKGVNAPLAAYAPVCPHLLKVNTPGVTCADVEQLNYRHRRRPMFPFERDLVWQPSPDGKSHEQD